MLARALQVMAGGAFNSKQESFADFAWQYRAACVGRFRQGRLAHERRCLDLTMNRSRAAALARMLQRARRREHVAHDEQAVSPTSRRPGLSSGPRSSRDLHLVRSFVCNGFRGGKTNVTSVLG